MVVLKSTTLSIHTLNAGDGDSIVIELPEESGGRGHIVVDCYKGEKTRDYLQALGAQDLPLVVATHPHYDHIAGLESVLVAFERNVGQFWDSGFRHVSKTWSDLVSYVSGREDIIFLRPTSGLMTRIAGVEITVLAPSIYLRNRYDTYGVNINNSSIVLKLAYGLDPASSVILAGDAQWDSWAKMTEEFPHFEKTSNPNQRVRVTKDFLPLKCQVLKVAHHGSKHGTALEAIERLRPRFAVISCGRPSKHDFPHPLAEGALNDLGTTLLHTHKGSVVVAMEPSGKVEAETLGDSVQQTPQPPQRA